MDKMKLSQKEYLMKYLSGKDKPTKKKKKLKVGTKKVKIIDDDVDLTHIRPMEAGEFEIFNTTEDAPQIVGIVDERGPVDFTDKTRWKIIADDGEGNVAISSNNNIKKHSDDEGTSSKVTKHYTKGQLNSESEKYYGNEYQSPSRQSKSISYDLSPPEKSPKHKKLSKNRHRKKSLSESSSDTTSSDSEANKKGKTKLHVHSKSRHSSNKLSTCDSDLIPPKSTEQRRDQNRSFESRSSDLDLSPPRTSRRDFTDDKTFCSSKNWKDQDQYERRHNSRGQSNKSRSQKNVSHKSKKYDNDSDLSPPRKFRNGSSHRTIITRQSDSDLSPPRKVRNESSRKSKVSRHSDSDLSPPRMSKSNARNSDYNSHRKSELSKHRRHEHDRSPRRRKSRWDDDSRKSSSPEVDKRMKKTLEGKTAGLQDAAALRDETIAHKKRERELFDKMSAEVSGIDQAPVLRDRKTGKRRDLKAEAAERREKEKRQEEINEKYSRWGKGLKQVDDYAEKLQQDSYEMSKPLARYADDADLDAELRAVEREGDPMLEYIKQQQIKEGKREPDAPSYRGSYAPNRYGIKPGNRWDGVDRSNGYEKKWFEARSARTAVQEEAYKWSTADM